MQRHVPERAIEAKYLGLDLPGKKLWSVHDNAKRDLPTGNTDPETFNHFFCNDHRQIVTVDCTIDEPAHRTVTNRGEEFAFRAANADEVAMKILEIQTNAEGTDGIPILFVKMLYSSILRILGHLYNSVIEAKILPAIWKNGLVPPTLRVLNPENPKDSRPIKVVPAVSKVVGFS